MESRRLERVGVAIGLRVLFLAILGALLVPLLFSGGDRSPEPPTERDLRKWQGGAGEPAAGTGSTEVRIEEGGQPQAGGQDIERQAAILVYLFDAAGKALHEGRLTQPARHEGIYLQLERSGHWLVKLDDGVDHALLRASAPRHASREVRIDPGTTPPGSELVVVLPKHLTRSIFGRVMDPHRRYLGGAQVVLSDPVGGYRSVETGSDGSFLFQFEEEQTTWEKMEVLPPRGTPWKPRTFRDVSSPTVFREIWLRKAEGLGAIHAHAPKPPEWFDWTLGSSPIEFSLLNESNGLCLGGGGSGKKFDYRFGRLLPGDYRVTVSVLGRTYAEGQASVDSGMEVILSLNNSIPQTIEGRIEAEWQTPPAIVRMVPDSVVRHVQSGAYNQFEAELLSAHDFDSIAPLKRRIQSSVVAENGSFQIKSPETGMQWLLFLAADGRCLAKQAISVDSGGGGVLDIGAVGDPGGRRRVRIQISGQLPELSGSRLCLLDRGGSVCRKPLDESSDTIRLPPLLPGSYSICLFRRAGSSTYRGTTPILRFVIPSGEGEVVVDWFFQ